MNTGGGNTTCQGKVLDGCILHNLECCHRGIPAGDVDRQCVRAAIKRAAECACNHRCNRSHIRSHPYDFSAVSISTLHAGGKAVPFVNIADWQHIDKGRGVFRVGFSRYDFGSPSGEFIGMVLVGRFRLDLTNWIGKFRCLTRVNRACADNAIVIVLPSNSVLTNTLAIYSSVSDIACDGSHFGSPACEGVGVLCISRLGRCCFVISRNSTLCYIGIGFKNSSVRIFPCYGVGNGSYISTKGDWCKIIICFFQNKDVLKHVAVLINRNIALAGSTVFNIFKIILMYVKVAVRQIYIGRSDGTVGFIPIFTSFIRRKLQELPCF